MKKRCSILMLGVASIAQAAEPATTLPVASGGEVALRMLGALMLVSAVFYGAVWALKRWRMLPGSAGKKGNLSIVECKAIGARQSLLVVGYEEKRFLVATSAQGVSFLTALPDGEESEPGAEPAAAGHFGQVLMAALQQRSWR